MGVIYLITNTCNKKKYVGQTRDDPNIRWKRHLWGGDNDEINPIVHVIQLGDILYNLAMQYGVTVQVDLCQVFRHILSKRRSLYNAI